MKKFIIKPLLLLAVIFVVSRCDLEVVEIDSVVLGESDSFDGLSTPWEALKSSYERLNGYADQANMYALAEVTADQQFVPTRGTDWGDNGVWRTLHQHTWNSQHSYVTTVWNNLNQWNFELDRIIDDKTTAIDMIKAEAKFLRAYHTYWLVDFYGKVPFRDPSGGPDIDPKVLEVEDAIDRILADLAPAIVDALPDLGPLWDNIDASKSAARFLRAKTLLNRAAWTGSDHAPADMDEVISLVDAIAGAGFEIQDDFFEIFARHGGGGRKLTRNTDGSVKDEDEGPVTEHDGNVETIFYTDASVGNMIWNGLHYFQKVADKDENDEIKVKDGKIEFTGAGWNGFSTTRDTFKLFGGNLPEDEALTEPSTTVGMDERRGYVPNNGIGYGFLVGQQYIIPETVAALEAGTEGVKLLDRAGVDLVFTLDYPGLVGNNERTGVRVLKYHPKDGPGKKGYILMRYSDAHLMKAEALLRKGNNAGALALVNELRVLRNASDLASLDLGELSNERGRELYKEGWRRNDLIRFGKFQDKWLFKDDQDPIRSLFPIPDIALSSNPNLKQNEGYAGYEGAE